MQVKRNAAAMASNCPKTPDSNQAVGSNNHKLANNTLRLFDPGTPQYKSKPIARSAAIMGIFIANLQAGLAMVFPAIYVT